MNLRLEHKEAELRAGGAQRLFLRKVLSPWTRRKAGLAVPSAVLLL